MAPDAPELEGLSDTSLQVHLIAPAGSTHVNVRLRADGGDWKVLDATTGGLDDCGVPFVIDEQCVASGLSADAVYEAVVKFKTRSGWSEQSNASPPLKLSSLRLPRPGAPVLEGVSATSIRVKYASSLGTTHVDVWVKANGGEWKSSESTDGSLVEPPCKQAWRPGEDVVLTGLTADTSYRVKLVAQNAFGWGDKGPESQPLKLEDSSSPTFLGSTSWAERDAAARKRAIDVDDVGTSAQHVKTESKIAKKTPARKARK